MTSGNIQEHESSPRQPESQCDVHGRIYAKKCGMDEMDMRAIDATRNQISPALKQSTYGLADPPRTKTLT